MKDQGLIRPTDLPQADQDLLTRLRKPEEFQIVDMIWLRTFYEDGSDAAFSALMRALPEETECTVFQDPRRYNYGGGDGWRRIFTRLPQILDPYGVSPETYEREKQKALEECHAHEEQDINDVEEQGGDPEDDGTYWMDLYSGFHYMSKVGMIFIADEETLRVAAENPNSAKVLAVWFDEMGRVVRHTRLTAQETSDVEMFESVMAGALKEKREWLRAKPGEDYDWDGPFGPPSITGEEADS